MTLAQTFLAHGRIGLRDAVAGIIEECYVGVLGVFGEALQLAGQLPGVAVGDQARLEAEIGETEKLADDCYRDDAAKKSGTLYWPALVMCDRQVFGNKTDVFFTAQDTDVTTGGLVRRVSRTGGGVCDYAGGPATDGTTSISRPRGLYIDDKRIYWTNRGKFDLSGTFISTCDLAGCCTEAKVLWNEGGDARAITGDDKYLYWVETESGQILKVGKP